MADNVSVTFSAQIGQLISGVDQVKEAIGSIAAPVNALVSVFSGFGEAFAGAFAISQVADFVSQMEALGTNTVRTAAILGGTTTEAQQLGFIAKATGGDTESLALSMERLQVNLQKAQSGTGPAAQALQALGLSAKSLIGLPLEEQLNRIADAVSKFADGGNKTAIVMELLGRGGAQMIPVLDKGRAGLDELRQAAENAGAVVSRDTVTALDRAGTAGTVLRASLTALGEAIVAAFANPLIEASNEMTTFIGDLSALIQTGHLGEAMMATLGTSIKIVGANFASTGRVLADLASLNGNLWLRIPADWQAGIDEMKRIQQEGDAQLVAMATQAKAEMQRILAAPDVTNKPQAPALNIIDKGALSAQLTQYETMVKTADAGYALLKEQYTADAAAHRITIEQETRDLLGALQFRHEAEDAVYAAAEQAAQGDAAKYATVVKQKTEADQKFALEHQKIIDEAVKKEEQQWSSALEPIVGAFNSQLKGLLSGQETWAQASKKILGDLLMDFIEWCEKRLLQWTVTQLAMATVSATTSKAGTNLPMIQGDVGQAFAGFTAFLAPVMGPAAIPAALGYAAATDATATSLASAAVGGYVTQSGLAIVHQGEIIPAAQVDMPYQGAGAGGGSNVTHNWNISAIDASGVQSFFRQNAGQIMRILNGYGGLNPSVA